MIHRSIGDVYIFISNHLNFNILRIDITDLDKLCNAVPHVPVKQPYV
jgi:hypothetical protein